MFNVYNGLAFVNTADGGIQALDTLMSCQWETEYATVDVHTINYTQVLPVSVQTEIELVYRTQPVIPQRGILNVAIDSSAYTVPYVLSSVEIGRYTTVRMFATSEMLEGDHAQRICVVRYDLGDGTYRELYALEHEKDLIIERQYAKEFTW